MDIQRCFEILELDSEFSIDELNHAYRDLVAVWHPDRFSNNPRLKRKAEEKLKTVNEAYRTVLSSLPSKLPPKSTGHGSVARNSIFNPASSGSTLGRTSKKANTTQFYSRRKAAADPQQRPWVRYLARIIDYLLFGLFLKLIGAGAVFHEVGIPVIIFPALFAFVWIIPEATLLSMFGATPGKWLLRTAVIDSFRLKPKFLSALRRSLSVWCNGMGMGVPFITPITLALAYFRLKRRGDTVWDHDGRSSVLQKKIGKPRVILAFLSSAVIAFFLILDPNLMMEAYKQAVRINPDDPGAHYNLGISYFKISRYDEAVEAYKQAITIKPDYAQAYYELARSYIELERFDEAIEACKQAIHIKPDYAQAYYSLGVSYAGIRLTEEAIRPLEEAVKIKPDYAQAYYELGCCYIELGRYNEAIEFFNTVQRLKPNYAETFYNLGVCYAKIRLTDEALESLNKAIRIKPDYAQAYHILGLTYLSFGNTSAAIEQHKTLKTLDKDLAEELYNYIENMPKPPPVANINKRNR